MIRILIRFAAIHRVTDLVVDDEITRPLREAVGRRWPGSKVAYLLTCRRCVSVWAAVALAACPAWLIDALAGSAVTILADEWRTERGVRALERRVRASMESAR